MYNFRARVDPGEYGGNMRGIRAGIWVGILSAYWIIVGGPARAEDWIADAKAGCKVKAVFHADGLAVQWTGDCKDGKADGDGTLAWVVKGELAVKDTGTFADGALEGSGMRKNLFRKWTYIGDFHAGLPEGKGRIAQEDGTVYDGDWVAGTQDGVGRFEFPSGNVYEGEVSKGLKVGHGRLTWPDTTFYEGPFVNDTAEGEGTCRDKNDGHIGPCIFRNGVFESWQ